MAVSGTADITMTGKVYCEAAGWLEVEHAVSTILRMTLQQATAANQDAANPTFTQASPANIVG